MFCNGMPCDCTNLFGLVTSLSEVFIYSFAFCIFLYFNRNIKHHYSVYIVSIISFVSFAIYATDIAKIYFNNSQHCILATKGASCFGYIP